MTAQLDKIVKSYRLPGFHVADCIVYVSRQLRGEFKDWPTNIQDTLFLKADELAKATSKKYVLYHCVCEWDFDEESWFVRAMCIAPVTH